MLTFFTTLKPCAPPFDIIQYNALKSWSVLPDVEILVFGDDDGAGDIAEAVGARYFPDIERSHGKPRVDTLFAQAWQEAHYDTCCYINADMIVFTDFVSAVRQVERAGINKWLVIGQRWDMPPHNGVLDIGAHGWQERVTAHTKNRGKKHARTGTDYFVHPRELWSHIPPLELGHFIWDNWLCHAAQHDEGAVVVDASACVFAVHQDHPAPLRWGGPEAGHNKRLWQARHWSLDAARYELTRGGDVRKR